TVAADAHAAAYVDLALVPVEPGTEIFSATQLMTYRRSPLEYFKRYRLGITDFNDGDERDNALGGEVAVGDDDTQSTRELRDFASVTAADIGTIVHEVVAAIGLWWDVSEEQCSEQNSEQNSELSAEHLQTLQAVIQKACSALNIRADGELYARIESDCRHVAEYMRARSITPRQLIHQEYSLTMPVQQDFITGTIDAIVDCGNGVVEVWDWKTNAMEGTSPQELLRRYDVQLRLYCLLLSKSMPHAASITARLVFTRTGQEAVLTMDAAAIADFEKELAVMISEIKRM
ncbi:MAG: RecB family exonuclease, partial [Candidatus Kapaibacterium sp.]